MTRGTGAPVREGGAGRCPGAAPEDSAGALCAGEWGCRVGRAGSSPEGLWTLWRGRIASPQRAVPGLPVQVEERASGEGESPAPGVAESLFLFVSVSRRRWPKGGSAPGRLRPGQRSPGAGAAPARPGRCGAVSLPPACKGERE